MRCFVRNSAYLCDPKNIHNHVSIDGKHKISSDLLELSTISRRNLGEFINAKQSNESVKLTTAHVTQEEKEESERIENKTIPELQYLIFRKINDLSNEVQDLQEEVYEKTVKNKTKAQHIKFYYVLCELEENEHIEKINEHVEEEQ